MYARRRSSTLPWLLSCLWLVIVFTTTVTACASSPPRPAATTPVSKGTATVVAGAPHCQPASPITTASVIGMPEVRGTTSGKSELWVLLFNAMVAKQELKIVWRMTGDGDLQVVAQGPRGTTIKPKWIEPHGRSNWSRPGAEWGTGFILPTPGCWDFHASRKDASGDVWLMVR